ncbi:N-acetyltransferase [Helicobacter jaachi]|uniref:N-acetyltransferase n=1 Tax=Helicobacter jaachi TaxID=1677920 RepID=A0A4U8TBH1_9HELI|nr:N-acetyltransferase [Helicobacter jaachi]TLD97249.1 N-acetyltransferase [Helicobacter jaachi]
MEFVITKPTLADIEQMRAIVSIEVKNGVILERSEDEMANAIRSYHLARYKQSGEIAGFCALYVYSKDLAEVRSLVVKKEFRGFGLGSKLVQSACEEGRHLGLKEILVLTYEANLFQRLGFVIIEKSLLPNQKIWADCIKCKHFPICDEVALINKLC